MTEPRLRCVACAREADGLWATACACGELLEVVQPPAKLSGAELAARFAARRAAKRGPDRSGVWRYRELIAPHLAPEEMLARGEGNTGLYASRPLAEWVGLSGDLWIKHEGENPTASFKDRGLCVAVSIARRADCRVLACASTGNTSSSLASYAALAGLPCVVFVPAGKISTGKLAQTLAYGARVLEVEGSFDEAMRLVEEAAEAFGLGLLNSVNPWRIEGQKSIALELLDELDWEAPDWIVLPSGNLGNISALGKALREAHAAGLIDRLPRIAGVQAAGAAPFARLVAARRENAAAELLPELAPETLATAIRIGKPRSWRKALREVEALDGEVLALPDEELLDAKAAIDAAGIGCEPASAAAVAGVRRLVAEGKIERGARVASILTGHLLKDPDLTARLHDGSLPGVPAPRPRARRRVASSLDALREALADLLGRAPPPPLR